MPMNKTLIRKETYVGRVKADCMDMEEKWHDIATDTVSDCEHIEEYLKKMDQHSELIDWKEGWQKESHEILTENWSEYWSKYNP